LRTPRSEGGAKRPATKKNKEELQMLRIKKNVNDLFLRRAAIIDVLDEASNINTGIEYPGNGFHSLYEAKFQTADGYTVHWAKIYNL